MAIAVIKADIVFEDGRNAFGQRCAEQIFVPFQIGFVRKFQFDFVISVRYGDVKLAVGVGFGGEKFAAARDGDFDGFKSVTVLRGGNESPRDGGFAVACKNVFQGFGFGVGDFRFNARGAKGGEGFQNNIARRIDNPRLTGFDVRAAIGFDDDRKGRIVRAFVVFQNLKPDFSRAFRQIFAARGVFDLHGFAQKSNVGARPISADRRAGFGFHAGK